jgi:DNA (cytosine-5)-methyltransferase 1
MIKGEPYQIVDIRFRMLKPEELKLGQGFPEDYIIDHDYTGKRYPSGKRVERIGNSVVPIMAKALTQANMPDKCIEEKAS